MQGMWCFNLLRNTEEKAVFNFPGWVHLQDKLETIDRMNN